MSNWKHDSHLETLSAAYAEAGQFDKAIEYLKKAIKLNPNAHKEVRNTMMTVFKSGKPYHQSSAE